MHGSVGGRGSELRGGHPPVVTLLNGGGGRGRSSPLPLGRGSPRGATSHGGGRGQISPQGRGSPRGASSYRDGRDQSSPPPLNAAGEDSSSASHARIYGMKYHELQKECKKRSLKAIGTTEQLRDRLLGKEGKFLSLKTLFYYYSNILYFHN